MSKTSKSTPAYMYDKTIYQNKERSNKHKIQHNDFFSRRRGMEVDREKGEERNTMDDASLQIMF